MNIKIIDSAMENRIIGVGRCSRWNIPRRKTMRADMLPLAQIKRLPRNPKLHDLEKIHQSIERFGFLERVEIGRASCRERV